jgi:hypothetical protein
MMFMIAFRVILIGIAVWLIANFIRYILAGKKPNDIVWGLFNSLKAVEPKVEQEKKEY